jgi:TIR domain
VSAKKAIFLSHANPEDNEFTRWLGAKLTLAGYEVWYDLQRLKGGDVSWDKIERAVREEAVRFVAIISRQSHGKDGVKKEWNLASILEKKNRGFVIPIRIDEFKFDDVTILFSGKHVLDFNRDWFGGLTQLFEALQDAHIRRASLPDAAQASLWWKAGLDAPIDLTVQEERLESSWLPIVSLPHAVETATKLTSINRIPLTDRNRAIPWFEHGNHLVSFAPRKLLIDLFKDQVPLESGTTLSTEDLLTGNVVFDRQVTPRDARNRVSFLVHQAWDLAMEQARLRQAELAGRQTVWFIPKGLMPNDVFEFLDDKNNRRRRQLVGRSEKYRVNWHYGVSARPTLGKPMRMELRAHILFSEDSGELVNPPTRTHRLRRGFCRNWWNARWRDFQRALLAYLSQGNSYIRLPVGGERYIELASLPFVFASPVGLSDNANQVNEEKIVVDEEVDDADAAEDGEEVPDNEVEQEEEL